MKSEPLVFIRDSRPIEKFKRELEEYPYTPRIQESAIMHNLREIERPRQKDARDAMTPLVKHSLPVKAGGIITWHDYYLATNVEKVLENCREMAEHLIKFPYGHNANMCLEYRRDIKEKAERLLAQLKEVL